MMSSLNRAAFLLVLTAVSLYGCSIGSLQFGDPGTSQPSATGSVYYKGDPKTPDAIVVDYEGGLVMTPDSGWVTTKESQADTLLSLAISHGYNMEQVVVKNSGKEMVEGILFVPKNPVSEIKRTYTFAADPDKRTFRIHETTNSNDMGDDDKARAKE